MDFMRSLPPAETPSTRERASLELLGRELAKKNRAPAALQQRVNTLSATLQAIQQSRFFRFAGIYWKLKARLK
jgi:hypothetical protein